MPAGRPQQVSPQLLYTVAQQFYGDFRRLAEGRSRRRPDEEKYRQLIDKWENIQFFGDDDKKRHKEIVDRAIQTGRLEVTRKEERLREIEDYEISANRDLYRISAAKASMKQLKIPDWMLRR